MKDYLQVLKVSRDDQIVVWNYQHFIDTGDGNDKTREYQNFKVPGLL